MISYLGMAQELKRLPKLMKLKVKEGLMIHGVLEELIEMRDEIDTLTWILNSNDED